VAASSSLTPLWLLSRQARSHSAVVSQQILAVVALSERWERRPRLCPDMQMTESDVAGSQLQVCRRDRHGERSWFEQPFAEGDVPHRTMSTFCAREKERFECVHEATAASSELRNLNSFTRRDIVRMRRTPRPCGRVSHASRSRNSRPALKESTTLCFRLSLSKI
jgi:hypothetical protein